MKTTSLLARHGLFGARHRITCLWLAWGAAVFLAANTQAAPYTNRWVWIFGWGLGRDSDVAEISRVLTTAGQHGFNGAVLSSGLDTLCQQSPDYFRRLAQVQAACETNHLELIPAIFSVGYGGGLLAHDRNLAEGLPVVDAPFVARGGEARLDSTNSARVRNGGFEEHTAHKFTGFAFCDQPGEISFADSEVKHSGAAAVRLENFTANPHGHGRVMQSVAVTPNRCYRFEVWVKTQDLRPANSFRLLALAGGRDIAPREFRLPATTEWRPLVMLFNSLNHTQVNLYAGLWGGHAGKVWLDDWRLEEVGPVNVLRRPGTPVSVRGAESGTVYTEGADYAPLRDPQLQPWRQDKPALALKLPPGTRIKEGERLLVSWYHSMLLNDSQVTACMGEPATGEIFDHEARLLVERLHPRHVLLNMDEVRMGGTCRACQGRNLGELLGQCVTRQVTALRRYAPDVQVAVWSDMLDPNHNAHGNYYLAEGDFTGSWNHVPKDLLIAVWGGEPREKSLRFFAGQGFHTLVSCYYDADNLNDVEAWLRLARDIPRVDGFMYTPWEKKYSLLPAFGDLLQR